MSSSCGLCGSTSLDELADRLEPLVGTTPIPLEVLAAVPERIRAEQDLFDLTGAVHAAAAFDVTGAPLVVREDIGRHNAVDKVVGRLLLDGALPAGELGLYVSGRASFEIVQKAWAAGFSALVAVSAPTSLAVDAARRGGLTLAGFVRGERVNVYTPRALHRWRPTCRLVRSSHRKLRPDLWVSAAPNGIGHQKPNHYGDMAKVAWDNRKHPKYAWDVLTKGVCDGCALGVAGFHDWTIEGVHLCTTRLRLLEVNTADPFDPKVLADAESLRSRPGGELRALGRLGHPMLRRRRETGAFTASTGTRRWRRSSTAIADAGPDRTAIYLTSRGITNEVYYVAGKAARAMGIAWVDSAARVCHAPSTLGLKQTIGVAATTCSLQDVIESDLIVLWGANPANNQPVFMKYLYLARRRGCRVVVVNPYLEPGLERYWVPSNVESAIVRHEDVRPARAGAAGRRRGLRQRRAQAAHRAGRGRPGLRRRPHRRLGRAGRRPRRSPARRAARRGRPHPRPGRGVRRRVRGRRRGDPGLVDGHHPAPRSRRRRARRS